MPAINQARLALVVVGELFLASNVLAQTAANPLPLLVVKDGDGKTVGQMLSIYCTTGGVCFPLIVLNVEGVPALLKVQEYGPEPVFMGGGGGSVYFSGPGCVGQAAVYQWNDLKPGVGTSFGVAGPDASLGTYKLYRSTTNTPATFVFQSNWHGGVCVNGTSSNNILLAEEVIPNPLQGFHGPTLSEPNKKWSVVGGTTIHQP